jgi:hypothetical protein
LPVSHKQRRPLPLVSFDALWLQESKGNAELM